MHRRRRRLPSRRTTSPTFAIRCKAAPLAVSAPSRGATTSFTSVPPRRERNRPARPCRSSHAGPSPSRRKAVFAASRQSSSRPPTPSPRATVNRWAVQCAGRSGGVVGRPPRDQVRLVIPLVASPPARTVIMPPAGSATTWSPLTARSPPAETNPEPGDERQRIVDSETLDDAVEVEEHAGRAQDDLCPRCRTARQRPARASSRWPRVGVELCEVAVVSCSDDRRADRRIDESGRRPGGLERLPQRTRERVRDDHRLLLGGVDAVQFGAHDETAEGSLAARRRGAGWRQAPARARRPRRPRSPLRGNGRCS